MRQESELNTSTRTNLIAITWTSTHQLRFVPPEQPVRGITSLAQTTFSFRQLPKTSPKCNSHSSVLPLAVHPIFSAVLLVGTALAEAHAAWDVPGCF